VIHRPRPLPARFRLLPALHKADPDLQTANRQLPWITIFNDQAVATNAWDSGSEDHTPGAEGPLLRQ